MPFIRSIGSRLSSTLKSLHLTKLTLRSTAPSSNEKLSTGNMKITLGSRVDGKGHFLNSRSLFGTTQQSSHVSEVDHGPSPSTLTGEQTRRAHHEFVAESRWPRKYPGTSDSTRFAQTDASWTTYGLGLPTRKSVKATSRSGRARKGYWNLLSIFDTIAARSTRASEATSKAELSSR